MDEDLTLYEVAPYVTSAVVVLFGDDGRVLVELHRDGLGLPGGRREEGDSTPFHTAQRELLEETGARMWAGEPFFTYGAGATHLCRAFLATRFQLPHPDDVHPCSGWATADELMHHGRFPVYCRMMFGELARRYARARQGSAGR